MDDVRVFDPGPLTKEAMIRAATLMVAAAAKRAKQ